MRFSELYEEDSKHLTFCFGRMNPPTLGHEKLMDTVAEVGGEYKIFPSRTQDKKENPLKPEDKIRFLKLLFPQHAGHIVDDANLNTIGKVCSYIYEQGYTHVTFVAGEDRLAVMGKLITDYNGVEGKAHGYYNFETIDLKSSGARDPDSSGIEGYSASKAREAAANGDLQGFAEATGSGELADEIFKLVRQGLGAKEMKAEQFIKEAPIEMDPEAPNNPVIYGHEKANPMTLEGRISQARNQLKELASMAESNDLVVWEKICKLAKGGMFMGLEQNLEQIRHGIQELAAKRKKGGIQSRGIDRSIG